MKRYVFDQHDHLIRTEDAEPECGIDFCDSCGDCLDCNGSDPCTENEDQEHFWVIYIETENKEPK